MSKSKRTALDRINKTITLGDIVALPAKTKYPTTTPDLLLGKVISIFERANEDYVGVAFDTAKVCQTHNIPQNPALIIGTRKIKHVEDAWPPGATITSGTGYERVIITSKGVYCLARKTIVISSQKEATA